MKQASIIKVLKLLNDFRVSEFEIKCGIPATTLSAAIAGRRSIPKKYLPEIEKEISYFLKTLSKPE